VSGVRHAGSERCGQYGCGAWQPAAAARCGWRRRLLARLTQKNSGLFQGRVIVRARNGVLAEAICAAIADSNVLSASQVVRNENGEEVRHTAACSRRAGALGRAIRSELGLRHCRSCIKTSPKQREPGGGARRATSLTCDLLGFRVKTSLLRRFCCLLDKLETWICRNRRKVRKGCRTTRIKCGEGRGGEERGIKFRQCT